MRIKTPKKRVRKNLFSPFFSPLFSSFSSVAGYSTATIAAAATYLLRTDFSQATSQPQSLSNGQVLDTTDEGIVDGSLTVKTTSGSASIDSNKFQSDASANWQAGFYGSGITVADGQIFQFQVGANLDGATNVGVVCGINGTSTSIDRGDFVASCYLIHYHTTGLMDVFFYDWSGGSYILFADDLSYEEVLATLVTDATNNLAFMYVESATHYPTPTLVGILPYSDSTAYLAGSSGVAGEGLFSNLKIPETLQPSLVTPTFEDDFSTDTITDGTWTVHSSSASITGGVFQKATYDDTVTEATVESTSADIYLKCTGVMYRGGSPTEVSITSPRLRFVDADNCWRLQTTTVLSATAPLVIVERVSGTNQTRATSGTNYTYPTTRTEEVWHFSVDSNDRYMGFIEGGPAPISYTDPSGYHNTETSHGIMLYENSITEAGDEAYIDDFQIYDTHQTITV